MEGLGSRLGIHVASFPGYTVRRSARKRGLERRLATAYSTAYRTPRNSTIGNFRNPYKSSPHLGVSRGLLEHPPAHAPGMLHPRGLQLSQDGLQPGEGHAHQCPRCHTHQGMGSGELRGEAGEGPRPLMQLRQGGLQREAVFSKHASSQASRKRLADAMSSGTFTVA